MTHLKPNFETWDSTDTEEAQKLYGLSTYLKNTEIESNNHENNDSNSKSDRISNLDYNTRALSQYSLEFLFGIISSKAIEYYYLHSFANPNKKTFPHLIQANVLALPIPKIDFSNKKSRSFQLYREICNYVDKINQDDQTDSKENTDKMEYIRKINQNVAKLFNITLSDLKLEK